LPLLLSKPSLRLAFYEVIGKNGVQSGKCPAAVVLTVCDPV
jgi:hypothetical protein